MHPDAVQAVTGGDHLIGHDTVRQLEQHVVDGHAVGAVLDDLDRLDVRTGTTESGGEGTQ